MNHSVKHPYQHQPAYARWNKAVTEIPPGTLDPVTAFPFTIAPADKVATAGSCFAQHIARHLALNGLNYYIAEPAHPLLSDELRTRYNYGTFSARYGNIYTVRQLLQLFRRAFEGFVPGDDAWTTSEGHLVDPLRPTIQPRGYASIEELRTDRAQHLRCVRRMFTELDYFVFTLGLTEEWVSERDGTAYPVCPGVHGGAFDPSVHKLVNHTVASVHADLEAFASRLFDINPRARIILTVSPVPLIATAEDRHVLVSTTYSKAVLRAAAQEFVNARPDLAAYFPSFEIITGAYTRGAYFAEDLRSVTESGVTHVMRVFLTRACTDIASATPTVPDVTMVDREEFLEKMDRTIKVVCEEELLQQ